MIVGELLARQRQIFARENSCMLARSKFALDERWEKRGRKYQYDVSSYCPEFLNDKNNISGNE